MLIALIITSLLSYFVGKQRGYETYRDDMTTVSNRLKIELRKKLEELNDKIS